MSEGCSSRDRTITYDEHGIPDGPVPAGARFSLLHIDRGDGVGGTDGRDGEEDDPDVDERKASDARMTRGGASVAGSSGQNDDAGRQPCDDNTLKKQVVLHANYEQTMMPPPSKQTRAPLALAAAADDESTDSDAEVHADSSMDANIAVRNQLNIAQRKSNPEHGAHARELKQSAKPGPATCAQSKPIPNVAVQRHRQAQAKAQAKARALQPANA